MFTQCSKCETVFRLSAEALRAAGGQVRCGRCGEVFNALASLAEDATGFTRGESSYELESRADEILQSTEPVEPVSTGALRNGAASGTGTAPPQRPPHPPPEPPPGVEVAHLKLLDPLDEDLESETSLEFTLPPGDLDRIFVETAPSVLALLVADGKRSAPAGGARRTAPVVAVTPRAPATAVAPAATVARTPASSPPPAGMPGSGALPAAALARPPSARAPAAAGSPSSSVAGLEVSEAVRREMLASYIHAQLPPINAPRRRVPLAAWLAAAAGLAVLLAVQLIRGNGPWLATHAPVLGLGTNPAAGISAYQLRQWGVTGDPAAPGTLRVRATIMNGSAQLQPYPLLRVTLANRFGTRVGQREFEPAQYLGKVTAHLLPPGGRVEATLEIRDPGKDAEGFEIDVCIRGTDKQVFCSGDAGAASH